MKKACIATFSLFFFITTHAQQQFQLLYHPFPSQKNACMKPVSGGGFLLISNYIDSAGEQGILLSRFNDQLTILWEKTINEQGLIEKAMSFSQDSMGNFYIVGYGQTTNNQFAMILKTDSSANIIWKKMFQYQTWFTTNKVLIHSLNSIYVMGQVQFNGGTFVEDSLLLLNLDSAGNIQWAKTYPANNGWNKGVDILQGSNNDLAVGVWDTKMHNYGGLSAYGLNGTKLWDYRWSLDGFNTNPFGSVNDMSGASNGGFALFGYNGTSTAYEVRDFIMRFTSSGNQLTWNEYAIEYNSDLYSANSIKGIHTQDGGHAFAGCISLPNLAYAVVLVKVDSNLVPQWCRLYGINNVYFSNTISLNQTIDHGYLICGNAQNNIFVNKTDSAGMNVCIDTSLNVSYQSTSSFQISHSGEQTVTFPSINYSPISLAISNQNSIDSLCALANYIPDTKREFSITLYPNPARNQFAISSLQLAIYEVEIFNLMGEKVYAAAFRNDQLTMNCEYFPEGIYFVTLTNEYGKISSQKLVIIH